jgi:hypothetical protein
VGQQGALTETVAIATALAGANLMVEKG